MKSFKDYLDNKNVVVNEKVQNGLASVKKTLKSSDEKSGIWKT